MKKKPIGKLNRSLKISGKKDLRKIYMGDIIFANI